jgi:hypothetical protein
MAPIPKPKYVLIVFLKDWFMTIPITAIIIPTNYQFI